MTGHEVDLPIRLEDGLKGEIEELLLNMPPGRKRPAHAADIAEGLMPSRTTRPGRRAEPG